MFMAKTALACVTLLITAGSVNAKGGQERLEFQGEIMGDIIASMIAEFEQDVDYSGDWKYAHSQVVNGEYAIDEFVPKNEDIDNWTRLFTQQNFRKKFSSPSNPEKMMAGLRKAMEKRCPEVVWSVVAEGKTDILYEFHFSDCAGVPSQHEIARILYGKWNIWRLAYARKGPPLEGQERQVWIDALSEPRIVTE